MLVLLQCEGFSQAKQFPWWTAFKNRRGTLMKIPKRSSYEETSVADDESEGKLSVTTSNAEDEDWLSKEKRREPIRFGKRNSDKVPVRINLRREPIRLG